LSYQELSAAPSKVAVPTPIEFACDDPSYHENCVVENYPHFEFRFYICGKGYFV
jgi:hypothetical protein